MYIIHVPLWSLQDLELFSIDRMDINKIVYFTCICEWVKSSLFVFNNLEMYWTIFGTAYDFFKQNYKWLENDKMKLEWDILLHYYVKSKRNLTEKDSMKFEWDIIALSCQRYINVHTYMYHVKIT